MRHDGLAIVVFATILDLVQQATPAELTGTAFISTTLFGGLAVEFFVETLGGALVGFVIGYVVYGITGFLNRVRGASVPLSYQHVIVWSGMHGVIPVALALSLGPTVPFQDQLQTMVFGVVVASMVVQGLLMSEVLRVTGVVESCQTDS